MPKISVIIPVYNQRDNLKTCLDAVLSSLYRDYEVIVVDDCSNDGSLEVVSEYGCRIVKCGMQSGPAAARNKGAAVSNGEILLFVDADVIVEKSTISKLVEYFDNHSDAAAVIGTYSDSSPYKDFFSQYKNLIQHYVDRHIEECTHAFWTGCGAVKKQIYYSMGGFDERFTMSSVEDIDLGYRMTDAGHKIYLDKDVKVTHFKKYDLWGILVSDFWKRAVPWTSLMIKYRKFEDRKDTKTADIPSVLSLMLFLIIAVLYLEGIAAYAPAIFLLLFLVGFFLAHNLNLLKYMFNKNGIYFVLVFIPMYMIACVAAGFGFLAGILMYAAKTSFGKDENSSYKSIFR